MNKNNNEDPANSDFLRILAIAALQNQEERGDEKTSRESYLLSHMSVCLLSAPDGPQLVARKPLKFSVIAKGADPEFLGQLYVAALLVDPITLRCVKHGLMHKKTVKARKSASPRVDEILYRIQPYQERKLEFQIVTGSAKKNVEKQVKVELRLYKNDNTYELIDSDFSPVYRILTHNSQLGRYCSF